jgi:hypothetical protein
VDTGSSGVAVKASRANKTASRPAHREDKIRLMRQRAMLTTAGWLLLSMAPALAQAPEPPSVAGQNAAAAPYVPAYRSLPKAEMRRRLIHCATEWQKLKAAGKDVGLIWRDFAETCTVRPPEATGR